MSISQQFQLVAEEAERAAAPAKLEATEAASRKFPWNTARTLHLMRIAAASPPFRHARGLTSGLSEIAATLNGEVAKLAPPRPRPLSGRVIKTHLDNIIAKRLAEERIYKTGSDEDHGELEQLLDDYISLQDDWEDEKNDKSNKTKKEKQREEEAKAILASSLSTIKSRKRSSESEAEVKDDLETKEEKDDVGRGVKRPAPEDDGVNESQKSKRARFGHDTALVDLFEAKAKAEMELRREEMALQRERMEDERRERAAEREFRTMQLQVMMGAIVGRGPGAPFIQGSLPLPPQPLAGASYALAQPFHAQPAIGRDASPFLGASADPALHERVAGVPFNHATPFQH